MIMEGYEKHPMKLQTGQKEGMHMKMGDLAISKDTLWLYLGVVV